MGVRIVLMTSWVLYVGGILVVLAASYLIFGYWKKRDIPLIRRTIGLLIMFYGAYLATLTGTTLSFVVPGIGSIALGAVTGAAVGFGTWLIIGTVGVVTGGVGVAVGAAAMAIIGAVLGGTGGAAGGFGFQRISYPLVAWYFWVPIILIGALFILGMRRKKKLLRALPPPSPKETLS